MMQVRARHRRAGTRLRLEQSAARNSACKHGDQNHCIERTALLVEQAERLEQANCPRRLLGEHDAQCQQRKGEPNHLGAAQPPEVDKRGVAVDLDRRCAPDGDRCNGETYADPGGLEPPVVAAESQHHRDEAETDGDQRIGDEITPVQDLGMWYRRQWQKIDDGERNQREADLHHIELMPLAELEKRRRNDPSNPRRGRRACQGEAETPAHFPGWRKCLEHVEKGDRGERRSGDACEEPDRQRRPQIVDEQMEQRGYEKNAEAVFAEAADSELGPHLHEQQRQADIGGHIGGHQPIGFCQGRPERSLNLIGVHADRVHAEAICQPQHERCGDVGGAPC